MTGRLCILAAALLAMTATAAKADLILATTNPITGACDANCGSFTDLGAQGFGNAPRILTLQTNDFESGASTPTGVTGDAISGADKASTPSIGSLGWTLNGAGVGIGFNSDQTGNSGISMQDLKLFLYDSGGTTLGSFDLAASLKPVQYTDPDLATQQGNGNAVFEFVLDGAGQLLWNSLALDGSDIIGLSAALGCQTAAAGCRNSNDGPDSFVAVDSRPSITLVPEPGTLAVFGAGLFGLGMVMRRRRHIAAS